MKKLLLGALLILGAYNLVKGQELVNEALEDKYVGSQKYGLDTYKRGYIILERKDILIQFRTSETQRFNEDTIVKSTDNFIIGKNKGNN